MVKKTQSTICQELVRRDGETRAPSRKIRVYYMSAEYDSSDTGDLTLVNSYNNFRLW